MKKVLLVINAICIVGFAASIVWEFFAIGKPEYFERHAVVMVFMLPCILFFFSRRLRRKM